MNNTLTIPLTKLLHPTSTTITSQLLASPSCPASCLILLIFTLVYSFRSPHHTMTLILLLMITAVLSPTALAQFDVPEWLSLDSLVPQDNGGKLPFLATDQLSVVDCSQISRENSRCSLIGDTEGVFVCRKIGNVPFSVCTPNVMATGNATVLGIEGDTCGCCGEECPQQACPCECNDGRGVMLEAKILRLWQVNRCVSRTLAEYLTPLRSEITCDTSCLAV